MKKFALTNETKKDNQSVYTYACENDTITFMMHPTKPFEFIIDDSNMSMKAINNFIDAWMVHAMDESTKNFAEKIQSITVI